MFKLVSWNIRQGGGSRRVEIVKSLLSYNADMIILSEFRNNDHGHYIRAKLLAQGYLHQIATAAPSNDNAVLIASKFAGHSQHFQKEGGDFPHAILKAKLDPFDVYGMYLPHKKKHILFDVLVEALSSDTPAILAGDFNTGKNYIDQKGKTFWYTEYLFKMEEMGYVDAFRAKHGEVKEYSWYSHQGNGFRYDHTYIHESIVPILTNCYYHHEDRENGLSDHSPMVLELG